MANLVHCHVAQEALREEARLRMIAKRAVAKPDLPFEGAGAVIIPAQVGLSAGLKVYPEK